MKIRKISFFLPLICVLVGGCSNSSEGIAPTTIKAEESNVKVLLNTERDLNDIVTLSFEPKDTTLKEVSWTCDENDIFTLDGSHILTKKVGQGVVKATSTVNKKLSVDINVRVVNLQPVYALESEDYTIEGLRNYYEVGEKVTFDIQVNKENSAIDEVFINDKVIMPENGCTYSFFMEDEPVIISITLQTSKMAKEILLSAENIEIDVNDGESKLFAFVAPIDTTDLPKWEVVEGQDVLSIKPNHHEVLIRGLKKGNAKIKVTYNELVYSECLIKVNNDSVMTIDGLNDVIDLDIDHELTLNPILSNGTGTFVFESNDENIVRVDENGIIKGISYGSGAITVTSVEYPDLFKIVTIEVINHGSEDNPLTINDVMNLGNMICKSSGDYSSLNVYVTGIAINNASTIGEFDLNNNDQSIHINESITTSTVAKVAQNDEVIIKGKVKNNQGNVVLANDNDNKVEVISNIRGNSLVSLGNSDNCMVTVNGESFAESISIQNGQIFTFEVVAVEGYKIKTVKENDNVLVSNNGVYSFEVKGNVVINVVSVDNTVPDISRAIYNIVYDLGTRKTAKSLETTEQLYDTFALESEVDIIDSVSQMEYIYGGGNGGRSETAWYTGNMIKIGTTSVNGSMTLELKIEVNYVKITGYVSDNASKIRIGNSASSDFGGETMDNQTTLVTCSGMNETSKEIVEGNFTSSILVEFTSTSSLKIATTNKKPIFITSIEFGVK